MINYRDLQPNQYNRRNFLQTVPLAAAGISLPFTALNAQPQNKQTGGIFEVAIASWSFNRLLPSYRPVYRQRGKDILKQMHLMDYPQFIAKLGVHGLELSDHQIPSYSIDFLLTFRKRIKEAGCHVTSVMHPGGNYATTNRREWIQTIIEAQKVVTVAGMLGARLVRCDIGMGYDQPHGMNQLVAATKEILTVARDYNIILATENHGQVAEKPDAIIRLVEAVNEPDFGVVADFRNFGDAVRAYGMKRFAPYAVGASAKGITHDANGEETTYDFPMCIDILKQSDFQGVLAVEFEGPGDQLNGVKNVLRLIDKYWYEKI